MDNGNFNKSSVTLTGVGLLTIFFSLALGLCNPNIGVFGVFGVIGDLKGVENGVPGVRLCGLGEYEFLKAASVPTRRPREAEAKRWAAGDISFSLSIDDPVLLGVCLKKKIHKV